jgi:ABC-type lipoprotein export system ATPase subunit
MISTKDITFSYQEDQTFLMPDLHCDAGNTILITGDSGKGKTTYLHLLAGMLQAKTGEIVIDGTNLNNLSNKKRDQFRGQNIGLVFQQSHFLQAFTVLENLEMASTLSSGKANSQKAKELLTRLGLKTQMHKKPHQLSLGQQQRASIARAVINEPKLILADEPTSSLDDKNASQVIELLTQLSKDYKAALVIVTHDSRVINQFTNKLTLV